MKTIIMWCVYLGGLGIVSAQLIEKDGDIKPPTVYVEFSPFLSGFDLVSAGAGFEWSRFQTGAAFTFGDHHFDKTLKDITFKNYGDLEFLHYQSEDVSFKVFLNQRRTNFYLGGLMNFTHWKVKDETNNLEDKITGAYVTLYTGFRWFPFKKIFYIDPNVGISANISSKRERFVGSKRYQFNDNFIEFTPNIQAGVRFILR